MKTNIIAGNWKSNKNVDESINWMTQFSQLHEQKSISKEDAVVIIAAPYTDLYALKLEISKAGLLIELSSQDLSPYKEGAYTGQISAKMIKNLVKWVIIGHSERRKYFHETDSDLFLKTQQAKEVGLGVIYCVSEVDMKVPAQVDIIAYEPIWAIGTGKSDTPDNAAGVISKIKADSGVKTALYGGSVTEENVSGYLNKTEIDGVLVGGASLEPKSFYNLILASLNK